MADKRCWNAYIDESGDEGFRKLGQRGQGANDASSEWLILAGVLIREEEDRERTNAVDRLRDALNRPAPKPLHWRNIRSHESKRRAVTLLASEPLFFCVVALWKPAFVAGAAAGLRKKGYLYNYAARYLIERLSWFAANGHRRLNLLFESRATTSYAELERYVAAIQEEPGCTIEPGSIASVRPVPSDRKGAQIADFYVGAASDALEPTPGGFLEEDYLMRLRGQLFRRSDRPVLSYGFKLFPEQQIDLSRYPWLDRL